ncbi:MAG: hypothetical protein QM676_10770 [Novosphingobium sp.]
MIFAILAAISLTVGATCLYLRSPNQPLTKGDVPRRPMLILGAGGLAVSLALLLRVMGPATAVFTWSVGLMLLWTVPPIVVRWLYFRRENVR